MSLVLFLLGGPGAARTGTLSVTLDALTSTTGGQGFAQTQQLVYCISNIARSGATRSDYAPPRGALTIAGVDRASAMLKRSCTIVELIDEQPNTCTLTVRAPRGGWEPMRFQEVIIGVGNITSRLFAGHILNIRRRLPKKGGQFIRYELDCSDYTWLLNHRRITGRRWANTSATTIVQQILTDFAPLISSSRVQAGLPTVDFTANHEETVAQALTRLAKMLADPSDQPAYWYVDYHKVLHFYTGIEPDANPVLLTSDASATGFWDMTVETDATQMRNRVHVLGQNTATTAEVAAGATAIPVDDTRMFGDSGGKALVDGNEITYTGKSVSTGPGDLTGVPSSGTGSVLYTVAQGASITVLATRENTISQAIVAQVIGDDHDGVIEHAVHDGNVGDAAARLLGDAQLVTFGSPYGETRITYKTRDKFARAGKAASVSLSDPISLVGTFLIQQVVIRIDMSENVFPLREVEAGVSKRDLVGILIELGTQQTGT